MNHEIHIEKFSKLITQKGYTEEFILPQAEPDDLNPALQNYLIAQTKANKGVLPDELNFIMGTAIDGPFYNHKNTIALFEVQYKDALGFNIPSMEIKRWDFLRGTPLAYKRINVNSPSDILSVTQANNLFSMKQIKAFVTLLSAKGYDMPCFSQERISFNPINVLDLESCLLTYRKGHHDFKNGRVSFPDKFAYAIYSELIPERLKAVCIFKIDFDQVKGIRVNDMELLRINNRHLLESIGHLKIDTQDEIPSKNEFKLLQPHELVKPAKSKGKKM